MWDVVRACVLAVLDVVIYQYSLIFTDHSMTLSIVNVMWIVFCGLSLTCLLC